VIIPLSLRSARLPARTNGLKTPQVSDGLTAEIRVFRAFWSAEPALRSEAAAPRSLHAYDYSIPT
jgi:hypothetical protein